MTSKLLDYIADLERQNRSLKQSNARYRTEVEKLQATVAALKRVDRETQHGPLLTDGTITKVRAALEKLKRGKYERSYGMRSL